MSDDDLEERVQIGPSVATWVARRLQRESAQWRNLATELVKQFRKDNSFVSKEMNAVLAKFEEMNKK